MLASLIESIKTEYNSIRIWPRETPPADLDTERTSVPRSAYDNERQANPSSKKFGPAKYRTHNLHIIIIHGWPSRGGVIVLENATPPDFDFLRLNALDPPLRRDADQTAEDAFCQGLLHLGATWWDSEARCLFVRKLENADEEAFDAVEADETLRPSKRECGWVRVAWPSHPPGALCVLACEKMITGRAGDEKLRPKHYGLISLARTMDERCTVLQRLGRTMYASIDEYQGPTFPRVWEEGHQGEKGPLVTQEFIDPSLYDGHPDDALGMTSMSKFPP